MDHGDIGAYVLLGELRRRGVDDDTIKAVEAMIRPMHEHEFLQWHEILTLFDHSPLLERYVNAYGSEGFDAVSRAAAAIVTAIKSDATPEEKQIAIRNEIKSIDKKSTYGKRYLPPVNKDAYSNACANVLTELKDKVKRSSKKEIIVVEKEMKKQLSKEALSLYCLLN